jgi:hypothetical protein
LSCRPGDAYARARCSASFDPLSDDALALYSALRGWAKALCSIDGDVLVTSETLASTARFGRHGLSVPETCAALLHSALEAVLVPHLQKALALRWNVQEPAGALYVVEALGGGVVAAPSMAALLASVHARCAGARARAGAYLRLRRRFIRSHSCVCPVGAVFLLSV